MNYDEVRDALRAELDKRKSKQCPTGLSAFCDEFGVSKSNTHSFLAGRDSLCTDLLRALGYRWVLVRDRWPVRAVDI